MSFNSMIYESIARYESFKAILHGEKLSNYMLQTESEEGHVYASLILSKAYEKAGEPALQDSTINSVKNHPLYAECCNEINNIFEN